jgi:DNA-binding Lrp family transcriptional regulator
MPAQLALRPMDVPVALQLVDSADSTYEQIGGMLGISQSTAHDSVRRLRAAGLVQAERLRPNRLALLEFLEHGVRYAFPAMLEAPAPGIPTAFSGPALADEIVADQPIVWPVASGTAFGPAISPLLPSVAELPERHPTLYRLLTLVDAVRVGRTRERSLAIDLLRSALRIQKRQVVYG